MKMENLEGSSNFGLRDFSGKCTTEVKKTQIKVKSIGNNRIFQKLSVSRAQVVKIVTKVAVLTINNLTRGSLLSLEPSLMERATSRSES